MSPDMEASMAGLRKFMFVNVYHNPIAKAEEEKAIGMIQSLYEYYVNHVDQLPEEYIDLMDKRGEPKERIVCDYISGMTDQYSRQKYTELFIPKSWQV